MHIVFYSNLLFIYTVRLDTLFLCNTLLNMRFYVLCIHINIFMHCALDVFYEENKDNYYEIGED